MNLKEKQLTAEYLYKGKIVNLRRDTAELPDGTSALREVVEHPGGVCVAALDENDDIYFVRQFRYPYFEELLEIPAGKRNSPDEDPLECGKRELMEETGITAKSYTFLGQLYPTPGYCGEIIWLYAATDLSLGESRPDSDEFLQVEKLSLKNAVEKIMSGEIKDAKTQATVLKLKLLRDCGKL